MTHPHDFALLHDLLDARLSPAAADDVRRRLADEPALAATHAELVRMRDALAARPVPVAVPADFLARVRARAGLPPSVAAPAATTRSSGPPTPHGTVGGGLRPRTVTSTGTSTGRGRIRGPTPAPSLRSARSRASSCRSPRPWGSRSARDCGLRSARTTSASSVATGRPRRWARRPPPPRSPCPIRSRSRSRYGGRRRRERRVARWRGRCQRQRGPAADSGRLPRARRRGPRGVARPVRRERRSAAPRPVPPPPLPAEPADQPAAQPAEPGGATPTGTPAARPAPGDVWDERTREPTDEKRERGLYAGLRRAEAGVDEVLVIRAASLDEARAHLALFALAPRGDPARARTLGVVERRAVSREAADDRAGAAPLGDRESDKDDVEVRRQKGGAGPVRDADVALGSFVTDLPSDVLEALASQDAPEAVESRRAGGIGKALEAAPRGGRGARRGRREPRRRRGTRNRGRPLRQHPPPSAPPVGAPSVGAPSVGAPSVSAPSVSAPSRQCPVRRGLRRPPLRRPPCRARHPPPSAPAGAGRGGRRRSGRSTRRPRAPTRRTSRPRTEAVRRRPDAGPRRLAARPGRRPPALRGWGFPGTWTRPLERRRGRPRFGGVGPARFPHGTALVVVA